MSGDISVDDALERLHGGSLQSFVERRKALAKELRASGDKSGARAVTAVAKPSLPAWVINQLVRGHRQAVDRAVAALDRQRDLSLGALSGGLDAGALAVAKRAEKQAMVEVASLAATVLEEDGHAASKTNVDRVTKSLRSAALDPNARPLLERGRLEREVAEGGFEAVASQLDPALLLAALTAKSQKPARAKRKVDAMFARSTRSDAEHADEAASGSPSTPARAPQRARVVSEPPPPSPRERAERQEQERLERLAAAKIAAAKARTDIADQRAVVVRAEARIVELESALAAAQREARSARRALGDLKVKLEQADKRIRLLDA